MIINAYSPYISILLLVMTKHPHFSHESKTLLRPGPNSLYCKSQLLRKTPPPLLGGGLSFFGLNKNLALVPLPFCPLANCRSVADDLAFVLSIFRP